jgi:molecular chaperone GrpE
MSAADELAAAAQAAADAEVAAAATASLEAAARVAQIKLAAERQATAEAYNEASRAASKGGGNNPGNQGGRQGGNNPGGGQANQGNQGGGKGKGGGRLKGEARGKGQGQRGSGNKPNADGLTILPPEFEDQFALPELDMLRVLSERDEYLARLQRLQADFDNFRKRMERQGFELKERASEGLINKLLPVLDVIDLALSHVEEGAEPPAALAQINGLLREILQREGLVRIDKAGVGFDPTIHDAVLLEPADEGSKGGQVVAQVMRTGYELKGRVVRPAMVSVKG